MMKIPNSRNVYCIDKNTIYVKGNYINYFKRDGSFGCSSLSFEGLKVKNKTYEGLTLVIENSDWYIKEVENHQEIFSINSISFEKFKLYLDDN